MSIRSLTRANSSGVVLTRLPEVENQIRSALETLAAGGEQALIARVQLRDYEHDPTFLQEEAVVYLIREFRREDRSDIVGDLLSLLTERIKRKVEKPLRYALDPRYLPDAYADALNTIYIGLMGIDSDNDDYAEVRFWTWLERKVLGVLRKYIGEQRRDAQTGSIDEVIVETGKADFIEVHANLRDKKIASDDAAFIEEALSVLDQKERTVYLMRHYAKWQIENEDPRVMTISRYFGKTPRTVRNWLNDAQEKIEKWQRGKEQ